MMKFFFVFASFLQCVIARKLQLSPKSNNAPTSLIAHDATDTSTSELQSGLEFTKYAIFSKAKWDPSMEKLEKWTDKSKDNGNVMLKNSSNHVTFSTVVSQKSKHEELFKSFVNNQETRYAGSKEGSEKAVEFLTSKFSAISSNLKVSLQEFNAHVLNTETTGMFLDYAKEGKKRKPTPAVNVIASYDVVIGSEGELPEQAPPLLIMGAHYDSIPQSGPAPGANDNGSGVAAMLTACGNIMKQVEGKKAEFASVPGPKRVVRLQFVAFAAEEEGLQGSFAYVNDLKSRKATVLQAITMDQVGFKKLDRSDELLNLIFETKGDNPNLQHLVDTLGRSALSLKAKEANNKAKIDTKTKKSVDLDLNVNYSGFGSDHMSFLNAGYTAVLLIERDNLFFASKFGHTASDTLDKIDFDFARRAADVAANAFLSLLGEQSRVA